MPASVVDTLTFRPGEIILYPGVPDPRDKLYQVREGLVRIQSVDDEGNALTLRFVRPGEYFGEEALAGIERIYFAEAATLTKVDELNPALLSPEETVELTVHLVSAISESYRTIQRLVSQRLKNRIAAALLTFADTPLATQDKAGNPVVHVTHDEIAAAVGSVRETVTKVIGELAREGYIRSGYGKVALINLKGLRELAHRQA